MEDLYAKKIERDAEVKKSLKNIQINTEMMKIFKHFYKNII